MQRQKLRQKPRRQKLTMSKHDITEGIGAALLDNKRSKTKGFDWYGPQVVLILAGLLVFFGVGTVYWAYNLDEVSTSSYYEDVINAAEEYPEIVPEVEKALKDEKLTRAEYRSIKEAKDKAIKDRLVSAFKEKNQ